jgi:ElaB/YqjD/DUF883 family membrane-anchored ribosome-binding protein
MKSQGTAREITMPISAEQLTGQLHKLMAEIEDLAKSAAQSAESSGSETAEGLRNTLSGVRQRLLDTENLLERELRQQGKAVDQYVHEHAWLTIGIAAAAAFMLGAAAVRKRD